MSTTHRNSSKIALANLLLPLCLVLLIPSSTLDAQIAERVIVKSDSPLYSTTTASRPPFAFLERGTEVEVEIEIADSGGTWCGIRDKDARSGYVKCTDLKREVAKKDNWRKRATVHNGRVTGGGTPVTILENRVLVPVVLGYKDRSIQAMLLLDTGASRTIINSDLAARLGIDPAEIRKGSAQGIGGIIVESAVTRLGYISVGPHVREDLTVHILKENRLQTGRDGLLGMDFLKDLRYFIDFKNHVIEWGT